jgi:hypothetical protein
MKKPGLIFLFLIIYSAIYGQETTETTDGRVSYVASGNIYVKFRTTDGISPGDTLYGKSNGNIVPLLIVNSLSSMSCVCTPVANSNPAVADAVFARPKKTSRTVMKNATVSPLTSSSQDNQNSGLVSQAPAKTGELKQRITGSVSANGYSDFSNTTASNSQRLRYNLNLDARNIANSKFSFETYTSFRHKIGDWSEVKNDIFSALKIYSLALAYEPTKSTRISIGRRINPRLSNIGASDGVQVDQKFGNFGIGVLAGTRPDYSNYGFNSKLLQYGGYLGFSTNKESRFSETSVAFMQQMNGSNIDRRFVYFQHSDNIIKNLYVFGTVEADLYKVSVDTSTGTSKTSGSPSLTSMYMSLRYRFSDRFSLSGSYDARRNVIYYETYKNYLDRLLEDQMRQGYRLQMNLRLARSLSLGLQGGYRWLKSDPKPARNAYAYLTYNNIPGIDISITVSATYLESSYMNGLIYSGMLTKDMFSGKLETSLGYRYADYTMPESLTDEVQHIGEANIFLILPAKFSLGVNYEGTFEKVNQYNRLYLSLRKRF